jgi:hypothetical protein
MNNFEVFLYFVCFAAIGGAAFAMMWSNIQSINIEMRNSNNDRLERQRKYIESFHDHPEAPEPGEEVMYVDLSREKLEDLYKQTDN